MKKNSKKIVFRADGSKRLGFGHIARSSTLALELRRIGYEVLFLTTVLDKQVVGFLDEKKLDFMGFHSPSLGHAIQYHINILNMFGSNTLVMDSYLASGALRKGLTDIGKNLIVIDDVYEHYTHSTAIINHNPSADPARYEHFRGKIFAGTEYAMIDRRFSEFAGEKRRDSPSILVMMGGSDALNQTSRVIKALDSLDDDFKIIAACGFYGEKEINNLKLRHECETVAGSFNIHEVMGRCDAAITAGGITTMELACLGVPFMVLLTNFRQEPNARIWERSGTAFYGGDTDKISEDELRESIAGFFARKEDWHEMAKKGRAMVDGRGAERLAKEIDAINSFGN